MADMCSVNKLAISELEHGDEAKARDLLRINIRKNPCDVTYNNLGVYYSLYGMLLRNGTVRSAGKVGLRYLLRASAITEDWRCIANAANAAWECEDFPLAYQLLRQAGKSIEDCAIRYNTGACLFRLGRFQDAAEEFAAVCTRDAALSITRQCGQNPFLPLAYCQLALNNRQETLDTLGKYREMWQSDPDDLLFVFCLRYFCGMYEEAMSECTELLAVWYLTDELLAMISDCVCHLPTLSEIPDIPEEKRNLWMRLNQDPGLRENMVRRYFYVPPFVCIYQFITGRNDYTEGT